MAKWVKADGTVHVLVPRRGTAWTLEEVQAAVGGPFEVMPGIASVIVMNELGRVAGLPVNAAATEYLHHIMAAKLGVTVAQLALEVGTRLRYLPVLHGDVLILDPEERL